MIVAKKYFYTFSLLLVFTTLPNLSIAATIAELTALAEKFDDPVSQYLLGQRYLNDNKVVYDSSKAAKWLKLAADKGHILASYKLGLLYYEGNGVKQNFAAAKKYLKEPANRGKEKAAFILGKIYDQGQGVSVNPKRALKYFSISAENYHPASLYKMATIYLYGKGISIDYNKAKEWAELAIQYEAEDARKLYELIKAEQGKKREPTVEQYQADAEKGDRNALYMMGKFYLTGTFGLSKDYKKAEAMLKKAANKNHVKAQEELGKNYYTGDRLPSDKKKAKFWLNIAADQHSTFAKNMLVDISEKEQKAKQNIAAKKLQEENPALSTMFLAANNGDRISQYNLAKAYLNGSNGVKQNIKDAINWYNKAANNGHIESQFSLGEIYLEGSLVDKNEIAGRKWLELAAEQGSSTAKILLSKLAKKSKQKENSSINILRQLAKSGEAEAQYTLAEHYFNGQFIEKNLDKAALWYLKAAKQGYAEAQYQIGVMFNEGQGVRQSNVSSRKWLQLASKQGHVKAQRRLIGSTTAHLVEIKEQHIKAAFLYNFSNYITWPDRKSPNPQNPVQYCALGTNAVDQLLESTIFEKRIEERTNSFKRLYSLTGIDDCEILFIGDNSIMPIQKIFSAVKGKAIFTASNMTDFAKQGGMINLSQQDKRIKVIINMDVVKESRLGINEKIQKLSTIISKI